MIDTWFKKDLEGIYATHAIAVCVDESNQAQFLLDTLSGAAVLYTVNTDLEELKVKYEIEKAEDKTLKYLIYTNRPISELKFIREYCETNGCIEIKYLQNYVKEKVHKQLNLNLHLDKEELISAAKVSVGKNQTYWMDLSHKGASEIFDLEKELLPFLDNPKTHLNKYDKKTQEIFFKKINELIGQNYVNKPSATLAKEVVDHLLNGLAHNNPNPTLFEVYKNWLDSKTYRKSLDTYLKKYKRTEKADIFAIHPSHPFVQVDEQWLSELGRNISDKNFVSNFLPKITQRLSNNTAKNLEISFWYSVKDILEFDEKNINQLASIEECITFYTHRFYKVDNAIRKLYSRFLVKKELIAPLQHYYKNLTVLLLDKWFRYFEDYASNQTGKIQEIIDGNADKTAIIVGDGVSFEFSQDIIKKVSKDYTLDKETQFMLAGLPSETEHNMSQLYVDSGEIIADKSDREKYLIKNNADKQLGFIDLENVNEQTDKDHYIICSCKNPDKLGETEQQKALKYFDSIAELYAHKIEQLLKNGYQNVYLVTDHGFVLTGILEESDKIEVAFNGKVKKSERFIRSEEKQTIDSHLLLEKEIAYADFHYCYYSKRLGPFKTPGVYGFSHGGLSPQETIIPFLKWSSNDSLNDSFQVRITNKASLNEVTGDLFSITLKGESSKNDLFSTERKVIMLFFDNDTKINQSDIILIENGIETKKEYSFGTHPIIQVKVLDATTKEQLDKITVKQSKARDLGGLL